MSIQAAGVSLLGSVTWRADNVEHGAVGYKTPCGRKIVLTAALVIKEVRRCAEVRGASIEVK
jgi:hypothetical protein